MHPHQLRTVHLGDHPEAWESAGFAVTSGPDGAGAVVLGDTTVVLTGAGDGFVGWALDDVGTDVDGITTVAPSSSSAAAPHPNGVVGLDHVVVSTDDGDRTVGAFAAAGLEVRGRRHGTAFGAEVVQTFLWAGRTIVEVVSPVGPPTDGRPDAGRATVFGLAVVTHDLPATCALLGDRIGRPRDAVQPGRQVATLRTRELGIGVPVLVMSPHVRRGDGPDHGRDGTTA